MNKRIKAKWVKALRSGKYKQARGVLKKDTRFCCLGVLTDIRSKSTGIRFSGRPSNPDMPSSSTCGWAGFDLDQATTLAKMNDGEGQPNRSFKYIANWIEKHL